MAKKFFHFVLFTLPLLTLISCSDNNGNDVIWDIAPAEIRIFIQDEDGNNLLDPAVEGNISGTDISISTGDETYMALWERKDLRPATKLYLAHFYGFIWSHAAFSEYIPQYFLLLGEYQGEGNYDMHLRLEIPQKNFACEFDYKHTYKWKNNKPHITNQIRYEGKTIKGQDLIVVLPRNSANE